MKASPTIPQQTVSTPKPAVKPHSLIPSYGGSQPLPPLPSFNTNIANAEHPFIKQFYQQYNSRFPISNQHQTTSPFDDVHFVKPFIPLDEPELPSEELIPIRLDVVVDGHRIQDTFTWNLNEKRMTPEQFAAHLCIDLDLPERYEYFIVASMKRQIYHYTQVKNKFKTKQREQIIIVKLDMILNGVSIVDQFEWDIMNKLNSPEVFAKSYCTDVGLGREFEVAIAHAIREQIFKHMANVVENKEYEKYKVVRPVPVKYALRKVDDLPLWAPALSQVDSRGRKPSFPGDHIIESNPYESFKKKRKLEENQSQVPETDDGVATKIESKSPRVSFLLKVPREQLANKDDAKKSENDET